MNFCRAMVLNRTARVLFVFLALLSRLAEAQRSDAPGGQAASERRHDVSRTAIRLLRDGQIDQALNVLEATGEASTTKLADDNGLSSACACLHRALSQLDSQTQFDLLSKWSMPTDQPLRLRVLTALVPTSVPPVEFARALGERPRAQSFPVSSIGEVNGIFCSGWSLVVAARGCGRLKKLIADIGPLVDKKDPHAELLMALAQIVDGRGDVTGLAGQLSSRTASIKRTLVEKPQKPSTDPGLRTIDPSNMILAAAALQHPALRRYGEELFAVLLENTKGRPSVHVRPFLQQAYATAILLEENGERAVASNVTSRLKYWVPVSSNLTGSSSPAPIDSVWLTQEKQILNVSGPGNDALLLRFPLRGEFQFQCETQFDSRSPTNSGLIFGGLGYQLVPGNEELRVIDAGGLILEKRSCPFFPRWPNRTYNRLSITVTPTSAVVSMNLHPMWTDRTGIETSPWFGLKSFGEVRPQFRNLKLTGNPVIPRSVRIVDGQALQGWNPQVYGERTRATAGNDWRIVDGLLRGVKNESTQSSSALQYLLAYQRPLLDGEAVSYEFLYQPGAGDVSPALGRVAFLLQPDGVRIHWVTDGDQDATGLSADNNVTEPLNRRGPRQLPLKLNDWNQVTLARSNGLVKLSLGDVLIYERPVDWTGDQRFGFYRPMMQTDAQIRNVVMSGDWPERLPQQFLDHPMATDVEPKSDAQRHRINRLFDEQFFADNVFSVRRKALSMPATQRFDFLSQWILPGPNHPGLRISGDFTPTRPSPVAFDAEDEHPELGGKVVSPVFDWLDAARELGRLVECRERLEAIPNSDDELEQRTKASLLIMIGLEQKDPALVDTAWEALFALLKKETPVVGDHHWPELLLATRGCERSPDNPIVSELVTELVLQRMLRWQQPDLARLHNHLASLYGQILARRADRTTGANVPSTGLRHWIPVAAGRAFPLGSGFPNLSWIRRDSNVVKVTCHDLDYLFYHQPLGGNFEVEADFVQPGPDPVAVLVAGSYAGPIWGLDRLVAGSFRASAPNILFEPALTNVGKPARFRAVVRDGIRTIYLNGRKILVTPLPEIVDPWIAIRCPGRHLGTVNDFRITGQPKVLDVVSLLSTSDLTGWLNYHEESWWEFIDKPDSIRGPNWENCLIGHKTSAPAGSSTENLIRYQRPLVEDGSIEYEFFYEPGVAEVHPALDRLAFVLHPSGVREHWITDGQYDRTDVIPNNMAVVATNRRGPAELPLKSRQWNRLSLTLRKSTATLQLNGVSIYERDLEPFNQRSFGLFHYADATEARARNVVMRGDWPKTLPPVPAQELAGKTTDWIDADLPRLKSVFTHSFENEGLPEEYFERSMPSPMKVTKDGIQASFTSDKEALTYEVIPRFSVSGDFDFEASFSQVQLATRTQYCGILLRAVFDDPQKPCYDLHRIMTNQPQQLSQSSVAFTEPVNPGASMWRAEVNACETDSGRLRLARRGKKLYYLFAEGDSERFHQFGSEDVSQSDIVRHGVRLQMFAFGGKTQAVWKNVSLRAERMTWFPLPSKSNVLVLKLIQTDGAGLRTLVAPASVGFTHIGSPEWSSDGRKILVDVSNGGTPTSHIFVVNADGTELKDLGLGCMPSFSADGSRIAFSQPGQGIMTMNSDGTDRQVVDRSGWGTQWSPDGEWIAYCKEGNITVVNQKTKQSRQLLTGEAAKRYSYIFWNLGWSHDSRAIAFKVQRSTTNQQEIAIAEIDSHDGFKVLQQDATMTHPDVSFSPDNKQVTVAIDRGAGQGYKLHGISRKDPGPPQLLDVIPANQVIDGASWSHDGKSIAFVVQQLAEPTEWVTGMKPDGLSK